MALNLTVHLFNFLKEIFNFLSCITSSFPYFPRGGFTGGGMFSESTTDDSPRCKKRNKCTTKLFVWLLKKLTISLDCSLILDSSVYLLTLINVATFNL